MTGPQRGKNCLCERRPSAGCHCPPAAPRLHWLPHTHPSGTSSAFLWSSFIIILLSLFSASECSYVPGNAADARTACSPEEGEGSARASSCSLLSALCTRIDCTHQAVWGSLSAAPKQRVSQNTSLSAIAVSLSGTPIKWTQLFWKLKGTNKWQGKKQQQQQQRPDF